MTYLELVNEVLVRLRETEVTAITDNAYSKMIGKMVNEAKRQVEDSWTWDVQSVILTTVITAGVTNYTIVGSGNKQKGVVINNTTNHFQLLNVPIQWILDQQQLTTAQSGNPTYYAWNGTDGTDNNIEIFPVPNGSSTLKINMFVSQVPLSSGTDILLVPSEPVILGAYARALLERGEDQGMNSSEAYSLYRNSLADHIALEASRFIENDSWVAT